MFVANDEWQKMLRDFNMLESLYLGVRHVECTLLTSSIAFFHVAVD